ncbi:MAG: response regulator [Acetobacteraceae bacterium]
MKHSVLLIEDEALVAMLLEDTLLELGFSVAGMVSRLEPAIAAVERGGFDVAILDVNLNGQPAYAIADKLRARGVLFVFATGYGAQGIRPAYRSVPVLQKPFGTAKLEAALKQALEGAQD